MLNWLLLSLALVIVLVALIATLSVIKEVDSKIKKYEKAGDSLKDEIRRSHEYETLSIKQNVKSLTWMYIGICVLLIAISIGFVIFL